jgi:hypothetical protein
MKLSLYILLPAIASAAVLVPKEAECNKKRKYVAISYLLPDVPVPRLTS